MRPLTTAVTLAFTVFLNSPALADVLWQDFSVSLLKGDNYRFNFPEQRIITFEHAAGTTWGDSFLFFDHSESANGVRGNYGEWSPRFSLNKLGGLSLENGWLKDILVSTTVEMSATQTNYLYGLGVDFKTPGFKYSRLNFYYRNNDHKADNWQTTFVWAVPFRLFNQQWLYDGFADWASSSASQAANLNYTSQLKMAINPWFNVKDPIYLGVEYVYWRNKFGIADSEKLPTNETNLNLLLKWHF